MRKIESAPMDAELKTLLANLGKLSDEQKKLILADLNVRDELYEKQIAQNTFMGFVNKVWPEFIGGRHHKIMARAF